eukprot:TRINITY_DN13776_c0_g2_i1.p2 TRINITY_DN13776_c0_g2~~TRINITY_DN13776_c0_g2_i1.p2  ORF type:complete len:184 (+),score=60.97 TRINITY_DN13776_c0_g2_i1:71-553(+)
MALAAARCSPSYHKAVPVVCELIAEVAQAAKDVTSVCPGLDLVEVPSVSVRDYILRIVTNLSFAPATSIVAFMLMDEFGKVAPITKLNVHMATAAAYRIAAMLANDSYDKFSRCARVCGVGKRELRCAIKRFLCTIKFNLCIPHAQIRDAESRLVRCAVA